MRDFDEIWRARLSDLEDKGRLRVLTDSARLPEGRIERQGGTLLDFSSNDYLGLSHHPEVIRRAEEYLDRYGAGSGASRLVTGNLPPFAAIEGKIARGKGAEAALVFVSGFQANASILPALLDGAPDPVLFADKLNHASLIHGCQASGVRQIRFRHNDLGHLESLLAQHREEGKSAFIVTETVFSMDGDRADVAALTQLADRYDAFLYLDEAHATGAVGPQGFGLAHGLAGPNCLVMGTFSKGMGSFGAYVACSASLRDYLVNRCAGLIYATALPPPVLGAIDAALDLIPHMDGERESLAANADRFRRLMRAAGEDCGASTTQIVPLLVGEEEEALRLAAGLQRHGILAVAIRPPTVPVGGSRLRFAFSASHAPEDIDAVAAALAMVRRAAA